MLLLTKAEMREVVRQLRPDVTDRQFLAMWARARFAAYQRRAQR